MTVEVSRPDRREHSDYFDSSAWTVVDVDKVDRVFATRTGPDEVRLDIDGKAEPSSEVGEPGDRINLSVWLTAGQFDRLAEKLADSEADECSAVGCHAREDLETVRIGLVETRAACPRHRKDVLGVSS